MARPRHIQALIGALQFERPRPELLSSLSDREWQELLSYADLCRLTLILAQSCRAQLPQWVQARVDRNLADNRQRFIATQRAYVEAAEALRAVGADHLVLKGFSQWPFFLADVCLRPQSDLDLYCPADSIYPARDALLEIGYRLCPSPEKIQVGDHLPMLIRPGTRRWRGNFYDPELMPAIELHHQFWGRSYVRFGPRNLDAFWRRRRKRRMGTVQFEALDALDAFAYSALHVLRHLLYEGLNAGHIHEIAFFLQHNAENERLWATWLSQHDDQLRRLTAVSSLLAAQWFGCRLPEAVEEEIQRLPRIVPRWFRKFGETALVNLFEFNKDALWLHLGLIDSSREKASVLVRRLFPLWVPPLDSRWVQETDEEPRTERGKLQKYATYFNWFGERVARHLRVLPSTLWGGLRLWSS